ncbi:hypothetical protein PsYK624_075860 [Phanerochaete sordida]|uniref:Uncharacterized protein n=1 Tax=Phanerochaete sordida TaxID=48140 RepID=A0A9P3LDE1_9APHY|nr:hypothetical protein PsYK624_075860 [Phanerochaete sordida]
MQSDNRDHGSQREPLAIPGSAAPAGLSSWKAWARGIGGRIFTWTRAAVSAGGTCVSATYYNIFLMRLPSWAFFHPALVKFEDVAREFFERDDLESAHEEKLCAKLTETWEQFKDEMAEGWPRVWRLCEGLGLSFSGHVAAFLCTSGQLPPVATALKLTADVCAIAAALLSHVMQSRSASMDECGDTPEYWYLTSRRKEKSAFRATSALLAAPCAWRNWAVLLYASCAVAMLAEPGSPLELVELMRSGWRLPAAASPVTEPPKTAPFTVATTAPATAFAIAAIVHGVAILLHFSELGHYVRRTPEESV